MKKLNFIFETHLVENDPEPKADIATCSGCGWRGGVDDCRTGEEGDLESGYYKIYMCPDCDESEECVDDYEYSRKQFKKLMEWQKRHPK